MRQHFYWNGTDWVDTPRFQKVRGINLISDTLSDVRNPINGKVYDSKSAYHSAIRAAGCHIVDQSELQPRRETRGEFVTKDEVKRAAYEVREGLHRRHF